MATQLIGERLRAAREAAGLTQQDLYYQLRNRGLGAPDVKTIGRWENSGRIKSEDLLMLAEFYGVEPQALVPSLMEIAAEARAEAERLRQRGRPPEPPEGTR